MISFSLSRCKGTKKIGNTKQFSFLFYAPSNDIIGFLLLHLCYVCDVAFCATR